MSPSETFFAFGFVSTLAVALLAVGYRHLPGLTTLYRICLYHQWKQPIPSKYALDDLKFCAVNES